METKYKIGVIGLKGLPAYGGAASVGENIINQLKYKYEFTIYSTSSHTNLKTGRYNDCQQIVFRRLPFKRLNTLYYYIISCIHAIIFGDYDLIHLHHRDAAFLILFLKIRYKVIITTHSIFQLRKKWEYYKFYFYLQDRIFIKLANRITCVSLNEQRLIHKKLNIEAKFIPNGVNIIDFKSLPSIDENDFLFFAANRIIHSKGLDVLIKSLKSINLPNKLIVAGDLSHTPTYAKIIIQESKSINISFIGLIKDKPLLFSYLKNAKLFIFPSSMEAMSMMLLEAASLKTPMIVSDIVENRDIFDKTEVLFFKTDDEDDLASKILWSLNNPGKMKAKADLAYRKLVNYYNWESISKKYAVEFDTLLGN